MCTNHNNLKKHLICRAEVMNLHSGLLFSLNDFYYLESIIDDNNFLPSFLLSNGDGSGNPFRVSAWQGDLKKPVISSQNMKVCLLKLGQSSDTVTRFRPSSIHENRVEAICTISQLCWEPHTGQWMPQCWNHGRELEAIYPPQVEFQPFMNFKWP